ncbi:asparaginase [Ideonella sp.]|uniref:asparaginase n=1 Tax=Ideonella sp. TaxID=1929293 RepID=UPI002B45A2CC|nr:asparaginase [Ideonella sp.]HJV69774.1 asparaginase [Ideonella sp.]
MQNNSQHSDGLVVILATGGTIAGSGDDVGYTAGQVGVADLVAAVPALAGRALEAEQVAQVDSKDMSHAIWRTLAERLVHHLARPEVAGIVVTHGTDTLEETAYFLHRVLGPAKPVVLTAAMRPVTSLQSDGPQNLLDAVTIAAHLDVRGVLAVLQGRVHGPVDVRKALPFALDAFSSGEAGPVALIQEGQLRALRPWPAGTPLGMSAIGTDPAAWPRVDIVVSHAGADGVVVDALVAAGARGLVVEGTGNGTVHASLLAALARAQATGVRVLRATRCAGAAVVGAPAGALPSAGELSPAKARIELLLEILTSAA